MPLGGSSFRGFPFDDEEGSGAWSELAARHPDIAARLRQRPATWARKRRPSSQDADDFGDRFGGFDRFPFDDIPPEFREHFPSHWNRRFEPQQQPAPQPQQPAEAQPAAPASPAPQQQAAATQTDDQPTQEQGIPQYGLRNTVDLGQTSPADPSLVDADDRNQRSMSAPPDGRTAQPRMSAPNQEQPRAEPHPSHVRVIPIVVEGRDEPVINKNVDHGTHYADAKPQQPHIDREQYFAEDGPMGYAHPPNFTRSFGAPYGKFRQPPQPFVHQKVYPQSASAFGRGASPQRAQSPKQHDDHFVNVPVHHDHPQQQQQKPQQQAQPPQQHQQHQQQQQQHQQQQQPQQQQQRQPTPPPQPKPQPSANDPITQILAIQTDVLNLMTDVENFKGTKKDKSYIYLDEMLTRNLIKLDNIETDGKENIRLARKEAIKCIQKCIAVLEAKAESNLNAAQPPSQEAVEENASQNQEMETKEPTEQKANGEVTTEAPKDEAQVEAQPAQEQTDDQTVPTLVADTRPEEPAQNVEPTPEQKKATPKKGAKNVKKRDKSKDKDSASSGKEENVEAMQVDSKGDKSNSQTMEVDAPSQ